MPSTRRTKSYCVALVLTSLAICVDSEPLFDGTEVIQLKIIGNVSALIRDKGEERDWHSFRLQANGEVLDVELRLRGNFRRSECTFPPVMVKFSQAQPRAPCLKVRPNSSW